MKEESRIRGARLTGRIGRSRGGEGHESRLEGDVGESHLEIYKFANE